MPGATDLISLFISRRTDACRLASRDAIDEATHTWTGPSLFFSFLSFHSSLASKKTWLKHHTPSAQPTCQLTCLLTNTHSLDLDLDLFSTSSFLFISFLPSFKILHLFLFLFPFDLFRFSLSLSLPQTERRHSHEHSLVQPTPTHILVLLFSSFLICSKNSRPHRPTSSKLAGENY